MSLYLNVYKLFHITSCEMPENEEKNTTKYCKIMLLLSMNENSTFPYKGEKYVRPCETHIVTAPHVIAPLTCKIRVEITSLSSSHVQKFQLLRSLYLRGSSGPRILLYLLDGNCRLPVFPTHQQNLLLRSPGNW